MIQVANEKLLKFWHNPF